MAQIVDREGGGEGEMSIAVGPNSTHRVSTYNSGCRCESCKEADRERQRRWRRKRRKNRARQPDDVMCIECGLFFRIEGLGQHQKWCDG